MYKENLLTKEQNGVEMSKSPISGFFFLFLERKIMLTLEINKNEVERARLVKEANVPVFLCTAKFLGGGTWVNFCWVCAAGLSEPLPHYSLFCSQL